MIAVTITIRCAYSVIDTNEDELRDCLEKAVAVMMTGQGVGPEHECERYETEVEIEDSD